MGTVEQAKNDILNSIILQRISVTRDVLLQCIKSNHISYNKGLITYPVRQLLDKAVMLLWNETYKSDLTIKDILINF